MTDLLHTGAARFVVGFPVRADAHVEVLPVVVDPVLFEQVADVFAQPGAGFPVAEVEQLHRIFIGGREHPFGVRLCEPTVDDRAFRFEPDHELRPDPVRRVGQRFESARETGAVDNPVADAGRPVAAGEIRPARTFVPARIEPEHFRHDAELFVAVDQRDGELFGQAAVLVARGRIAPVESRRKRVFGEFAVDFAGVVRQHEAAETVVAVHRVVALPEQHTDPRRADRFAGAEV